MLVVYTKKLNLAFSAVLFVLFKSIVRFKSNADENSVIVFIWDWLFMFSITLDKRSARISIIKRFFGARKE